MSDTQPPNDQVKLPADIPLEDIDKLLEAEDPEFSKSLEEVRAVEPDKGVTIESSAIDESLADEAIDDPEKARLTVAGKIKLQLRNALTRFKLACKAGVKNAGKNFVQFLKVRPKQFALFTVKSVKTGAKNIMVPVKTFQDATQLQRISVLLLTAIVLGSTWVLLANFKGIWLPQINERLLTSFEPFADRVDTFNPKDDGESFYSAFPQERHEFLFPKMKVNLRRTADNSNPMGAFEVIVLLDSKDTAIEVADRQVEFGDLLQRAFEEESFNDLETDMGKTKLKSHLMRELNQKLTQGWAKEISFKTFILKP
jgi:flagellar basal body-associated protein FliL